MTITDCHSPWMMERANFSLTTYMYWNNTVARDLNARPAFDISVVRAVDVAECVAAVRTPVRTLPRGASVPCDGRRTTAKTDRIFLPGERFDVLLRFLWLPQSYVVVMPIPQTTSLVQITSRWFVMENSLR
ncbi:hypothetical protein Hamer_G010130 [Homarus americanus]|uniref:Uncharacterized protein n=1 Tax=Homarus americanus TaxID=6706 RepID=A0A8J5K5A7_HOMAM|nr:hypothetical protein Hamer_G010130 [Homarus americanus]